MARITVEDCLENIGNIFELVRVAAKRARRLADSPAGVRPVHLVAVLDPRVALRHLGGFFGQPFREESWPPAIGLVHQQPALTHEDHPALSIQAYVRGELRGSLWHEAAVVPVHRHRWHEPTPRELVVHGGRHRIRDWVVARAAPR